MLSSNHNKRNDSLDALRGLAILMMVLSGSIAFGGVLPGWMYHAQVPPPLHKFNPNIPGITWVDLVFPFFLFSMGVAIPLALKKWENVKKANVQVWLIAFRRYVLLTWFALFILHMRAWVITENPGIKEYLLSLLAFVLLFFQLFQPKSEAKKSIFFGLKLAAYIIAALLLYTLPFHKGQGFLKEKSDIIILVLANMAFFGTLIWWHTRNTPWVRIGILPFIMAIFLGSKETGSINQTIFNWSPLSWMFSFYYLKYLFIIIPGTLVGDWMKKPSENQIPSKKLYWAGAIFLVIIMVNTCLLYTRSLVLNLTITTALVLVGYGLLSNYKYSLIFKIFNLGSYVLLLGLFFEAYEGGIKKDSSTYSYYFVTTGLACFMLIALYSWQANKTGANIIRYLAINGQNPMVAYVAGSLVVIPLLHITGMQSTFDLLNANAWTGLLKGLLFTGGVSVITYIFTQQKWYWKT